MAGEGQGGVAGLLAELSGHLLAVREILSRPEIQRLVAYRERRRGCREAYTWVRNKSGSRYWYWYLKCPGRRPSSVYLGSSPEAHRALAEAAGAVARVRHALAGLDLGGLAGQLAEAARRLEKLEAAAPAEAAHHDASTPAGGGDPGEPQPSRLPHSSRRTHGENSGQNEAEAAGMLSTPPPQTQRTTPRSKATRAPRGPARGRAQKTRRPGEEQEEGRTRPPGNAQEAGKRGGERETPKEPPEETSPRPTTTARKEPATAISPNTSVRARTARSSQAPTSNPH